MQSLRALSGGRVPEYRGSPRSNFLENFFLRNRRAEKGLEGTFAKRTEPITHVIGVFFPEHVTGTMAGNALRTPLILFEMKRDQAAPQGWLVEDGELSNPSLATVL